MTSRLRTLLIGGALGTTTLVAMGGGAVAWAQTDGTTPPAEAQAEEGPSRRSEKRAEHDAALAAKLGTTPEALQAARQSAHDAVVAELGELERPESRPETEAEREALQAQIEARRDLMKTKFAEALGITVEELDAARLSVAEDELNAKVAAGELTQEEADARLEQLRSGELPLEGRGGRGGPGRGHGGEMGERGAEAREALAAKLGTTPEALQAARQSAHEAVVAELGELERPESRPETDEEREALVAQMQERRELENAKFAEALGISVDELKAARIAVVQDELNAKVAAGEMTQEEADAKIQALQDGELPAGGFGGHGGPGGRRGPGGGFGD